MRGATKLGLLAYSTNTGLGVQTQEFAEHMQPDRVLLVDLSAMNHVTVHPERFAAFERVESHNFPGECHIGKFLKGLDVIFVCETPLNYDLFSEARRLGVKTILQPNHEFNDYYRRPTAPHPDLFALPSPWHYDDLPYKNKRLLNVPVATEKLTRHPGDRPFRRFLHVAGRPAVHDRNGTLQTIAAFRRVKREDIRLTVKVQTTFHVEYLAAAGTDARISIDATDPLNYWDIYQGYDCLIMPRKYGGLCLPMQEALGCGIPVIMTDVSPNTEVLPPWWLVSATKTGEFMTRTMIDIFTADERALAAKIQGLCELDAQAAAGEYLAARNLGDALSWQRLAPVYEAVIEEVVRG